MNKFIAAALFLFVTALSSCVSDHPLVNETSFNMAERDPDARLLKEIRELTLRDSVRIALANNPGYREAHQAVVSAKMRYYQALGAYSPVISASFALGDQLYDGSGGSTVPVRDQVFYTYTTVQANWILFDGLNREFNMLSAKRGHRIQQELDENARRLLVRAVAYAYNDILLARDQIRIADADFTFQTKMAREAELKYRAGTTPRSEVLNFRGRANNARENRESAKYHYELARYTLALLMGYVRGELPADITFPEIPEAVKQEMLSVDLYLDLALTNRPDLKAYREKLKISEYELYRAYGSFLPVISLFTNYSYSSNSTQNAGNNPTGFGNFYVEGNSFNYGLAASLTLFNGGIRYNRIREARSELTASELAGAELWLKVVNDVRSAYANCEYSRRIMEICRENQKLMAEQRDLVMKEYLAGEIEVTRLNEAQTNLVHSNMALADAVIKLHKAHEQLAAAVHANGTVVR
ncbi:MAG: TolC family protein [Victivallales bacterium]